MISSIIRRLLPRNSSQFPHDENGDILYGIWQRQGHLDKARTVDFSIIAPTEIEAQNCAAALSKFGGKTEISYFSEKNCWDILLSVRIVPSWENITKMEQDIERLAKPFNGANDGWGFFSN